MTWANDNSARFRLASEAIKQPSEVIAAAAARPTSDFVFPRDEGSSLPSSLAELEASATPGADIVSLMGYGPATPPTSLFIAPAVAAKIGDFDLGMAPRVAEDSRLPGINTWAFEARTEQMLSLTSSASIDFSTGAFTGLSIIALDSFSGSHQVLGRRVVAGWTLRTAGGNGLTFLTYASSGVSSTVTATGLDTIDPIVVLWGRTAGGTLFIYHRAAGNTSAGTVRNASNSGDLAIGDATAGAEDAQLGHHAVHAFWPGVGDMDETHRAALAQGLGLEAA